MKFSVYETATGRVLFGGSADRPELLVGEGQGIHLDVEFTDGYFADGVHHQLPEQPSPHHVFNYATGAWEDPRGLEERRAAQWARIKAARDAFEFSPFTWDGSVFDGTQASQQRIQGAAQLAVLAQMGGEPFLQGWTLADNTVRELTGPDMIAVGMALGVHIATAHELGRIKRRELEEATTLAEIDAVVW